MKKLYFVLCIFFSGLTLQAQDQVIFMHYHLSPILVNPAAAGFDDDHQLHLNFRNQWTGFPGAPTTYSVNYHGALGRTLGLGGSILSENIASMNRIRMQLNYAFRFEFDDIKLAGGFSTEFHTMRLNASAASNTFSDPGDPLLANFMDGQKIFDVSLGFFGSFKEKGYVGLAFPNLVVAKINDIESGEAQGDLFRYFVFQGGYRFLLEEYNFSLEPSFMMRQVLESPFLYDFNLKAGFLEDRFVTGLSYRAGLGGALGILLGTEFSGLRVYYSFDIAFQPFQQYNSGAHEVTVGFEFGGKKDNQYKR